MQRAVVLKWGEGQNEVCNVPVPSMVQKLNPQLCAALPAHHTLTGCDSNHSLSGINKGKSFGILSSNPEHQKGLAKLGQKPDMNKLTNADCEKFVCSLYTRVQKAGTTCDTDRYWLFCQKKNRDMKGCHQHQTA